MPIFLIAQLRHTTSSAADFSDRPEQKFSLQEGEVIHLEDSDEKDPALKAVAMYSFRVVAASDEACTLEQVADTMAHKNANGFSAADGKTTIDLHLGDEAPVMVGPNVPGGGPVWMLRLKNG